MTEKSNIKKIRENTKKKTNKPISGIRLLNLVYYFTIVFKNACIRDGATVYSN